MRIQEELIAVHDYDYLCVPHSQLTNLVHENLYALQEVFPSDQLAEDGVEIVHHITILFGILPNSFNYDLLRRAIEGYGPVHYTIGPLEKFEQNDYDVLKYRVDSDELNDLMIRARDAVAITSESYSTADHEYQPHLTVAYVKKGAADPLLGTGSLTGYTELIDGVEFVDRYDRKLRIPLCVG